MPSKLKKKFFPRLGQEIKGTEKRKCSYKGCKWHDGAIKNIWRYDYGVYMPDGKYYCPKHANEIELSTEKSLTLTKKENNIEP